ncbi:MAG: hypothetical protein Q9177_003323 [Variospora cf. flavescens]
MKEKTTEYTDRVPVDKDVPEDFSYVHQKGLEHKLIVGTISPSVYSLRRKGQIVRLIDTPGFDDSKRSDIDVLTDLAFHLASAYQTNPKILLSGIIYLHPIDQPKLAGTARKNLAMFKLLCGDESLQSVVLATTMWRDEIQADATQRVTQLESTPEYWGRMIEHGSSVFRHDNTPGSALRIIDHIIARRERIVLSIQKQMVDEHRTIDQTSAGQLERHEIIKEKDRAARRLEENREELEASLRAKEQQNVHQLSEEQQKYEREIQQKDHDIEALRMSVAELQKQKEAQMVREEEELQAFYAQQDAKYAEMARELAALLQQDTQTSSDNSGQKEGAAAAAGSQEDKAIVERMMNKMNDTGLRIQMLSEQMDAIENERRMLKAQEKKKFAKRGMQYGGAGAAFGGIAAGAAMLCSVM